MIIGNTERKADQEMKGCRRKQRGAEDENRTNVCCVYGPISHEERNHYVLQTY